MCGRYAVTRSPRELADTFDAETVDAGPSPLQGSQGEAPQGEGSQGEGAPDGSAARAGGEPNFNASPSQQLPIVIERAGSDHHGSDGDGGTDGGDGGEGGGAGSAGSPRRWLRPAGWGLLPFWAKEPKVGYKMINARVETVTEKPAYKAAAKRRRAIVPADGFIEWHKPSSGAKQPYFLHPPGGELLGFAGLYELWRDPAVDDDADPRAFRWTFTILTQSAEDTTGWVHDRSSVVLTPSSYGPWLDPALTDPDDVRALLNALPGTVLEPRPISTEINSPRNNRSGLLDPVEPAPSTT